MVEALKCKLLCTFVLDLWQLLKDSFPATVHNTNGQYQQRRIRQTVRMAAF